MKLNILRFVSVALLATSVVACEDFLDKQPPSYVVPEDYYQTESQVQAIANKLYTDVLPSHGGNYGTLPTMFTQTIRQLFPQTADMQQISGRLGKPTATGHGAISAISIIP